MIGFRQSTIANKIILGFFPLIFLLGLIPIYALTNISKMTEMNQRMVQEDIYIIESIDDLFNELLLQESFGQHYLIAQTEEVKKHFIQHGDTFKSLLNALKKRVTDPGLSAKISQIAAHHQRYLVMYLTHYQSLETVYDDDLTVSARRISVQFDRLSRFINDMKQEAYKHQENRVREIAQISNTSFKIMAALAIAGILLGIGSSFIAFRYIIRSINQLIQATEEIARGNFDFVPAIKGEGELKVLAQSFSEMGHRLAALEKSNLDKNPLTRLPGGVTIESVLKERLDEERPTAFCLVDIDHFKAFNDRYGYATGNSVIIMTAQTIERSAKKYGAETDFVGHIGGDDFVFITTPIKYERICQEIIKRFDAKINEFYNAQDIANGYIESTSRQGEKMKFPVMTISIAVVTNMDKKECSHIRFGEIAAELKKKAKTLNGSVFVVDQRKDL